MKKKNKLKQNAITNQKKKKLHDRKLKGKNNKLKQNAVTNTKRTKPHLQGGFKEASTQGLQTQTRRKHQTKEKTNRLARVSHEAAVWKVSKQRQTLKSFSNGLDTFANFAKIRV